MKSNVARILATPHELDDKSCEDIAKAVNLLVADSFALFVKTKNFHWHMSGANFRDHHRMLDDHAEEIFHSIDILAERVRKLGQTTIKSINEIAKLQSISDDNGANLEPNDMLHALLIDNKKFVQNLRKAHEVCSNKNDFATTSLLEEFIDQTETRVWFLFETVS